MHVSREMSRGCPAWLVVPLLMLLAPLADAKIPFDGLLLELSSPAVFAVDPGDDEPRTKAATATAVLTLVSSSDVVAQPSKVTLTATVSGAGLKGNVTFKSAGNTLGTAVITKNAAVLTLLLPAAIHSLTAVFAAAGGDVVSAPVIVVVDNALSCS